MQQYAMRPTACTRRWLLRCLYLFPLLAVSQSFAATIRVDDNATTNGPSDLANWTNAFNNLQDAQAWAEQTLGADEIRIAKGIYTPSPTSVADESVSFVMRSLCTIKGGYAGLSVLGADPESRNVAMYETILSGDLNGDDDPRSPFDVALTDDNSDHVVLAPASLVASVLDGVTITSGNAMELTGVLVFPPPQEIPACYNDAPPPKSGGAGLECIGARPTIRNCTFRFNQSSAGGAVRLLCESNPIISRCTFDTNRASEGSVWHGSGGAIYMYGNCSPKIFNCVFRNNQADHIGGGIALQQAGSPDITNCLFINNAAGVDNVDYGGGMRSGFDCTPTLYNCTFYGNSAYSGGGFSAGRDDPPGDGAVLVKSSTFWNNTATVGSQISIGPSGSAVVTISHCDVQDLATTGISGTLAASIMNFDANPEFENAGTFDFRIRFTSPCLNNGDPTGLPLDSADLDGDGISNEVLPLDLALSTRQVHPTNCIDVGAYENQTESCIGDLTSSGGTGPDGAVDAIDLGFLLGRWGTAGGLSDLAPNECGDGVVNGADLTVLLEHWGQCSENQSAMQAQAVMEGEEGTAPMTPFDIATQMGFESIAEFVDWLVEQGDEAMLDWITMLFGT